MVTGYDPSEKRGWFRPEGACVNMNQHKYREKEAHCDMQYIGQNQPTDAKKCCYCNFG